MARLWLWCLLETGKCSPSRASETLWSAALHQTADGEKYHRSSRCEWVDSYWRRAGSAATLRWWRRRLPNDELSPQILGAKKNKKNFNANRFYPLTLTLNQPTTTTTTRNLILINQLLFLPPLPSLSLSPSSRCENNNNKTEIHHSTFNISSSRNILILSLIRTLILLSALYPQSTHTRDLI